MRGYVAGSRHRQGDIWPPLPDKLHRVEQGVESLVVRDAAEEEEPGTLGEVRHYDLSDSMRNDLDRTANITRRHQLIGQCLRMHEG